MVVTVWSSGGTWISMPMCGGGPRSMQQAGEDRVRKTKPSVVRESSCEARRGKDKQPTVERMSTDHHT